MREENIEVGKPCIGAAHTRLTLLGPKNGGSDSHSLQPSRQRIEAVSITFLPGRLAHTSEGNLSVGYQVDDLRHHGCCSSVRKKTKRQARTARPLLGQPRRANEPCRWAHGPPNPASPLQPHTAAHQLSGLGSLGKLTVLSTIT